MVLAVGRPGAAATIPIDSTADDFSIVWSFAGCGGTCTATANFDVTTFNATTLVLDVDVINTTVAAGEFLEGIGWNMDPAATGASLTTPGSFLDEVSLNQVFPSFNTLNICVQDNPPPGSCGSGQPNGIPSPGADNFVLSLTGDFSGGLVTLDTFAVKYSGALGSFEGEGEQPPTTGRSDEPGTPPPTVPEPASMLLLGSGLAAAALKMRRGRR
jgi:hypothetical protein